jgi:hypothetical protein
MILRYFANTTSCLTNIDTTQTITAPKRKTTTNLPGPSSRAPKQGRMPALPRLPRRGLSSASLSSVSSAGDSRSNFDAGVLSPSLLSSTTSTPVSSNSRPPRKTTLSATSVNLSRYQSDTSWSSASHLGSGGHQQIHENQQIQGVKLKCLQEMKEKRRQVKKKAVFYS